MWNVPGVVHWTGSASIWGSVIYRMENWFHGLGLNGLSGRLVASIALVAFIIVLAKSLFFISVSYSVVNETIVLRNDGVVEVVLGVLLDEGLNEIPLPVEPLATTIIVNASGSLIPPLYVNGTLYVPLEEPSEAEIRYIANVSITNGTIVFKVKPLGEAVLVVEPGVVLLSLPRNITGYRVGDGTLYIIFTGETKIRYTLLEAIAPPSPATTTPTTTPTITPTTPVQPTTVVTPTKTVRELTTETITESPTPTTSPPPETTTPTQTQPISTTPTATKTAPTTPVVTKRETQLDTLLVVAAITVVALVIVAEIVIVLRRRRAQSASEEPIVEEATRLDDTDYAILRQIQAMGGEVLQSQLQKVMGLPKTTLWRRIRKLETLGYVRIYREGKTNRVTLVRLPEELQ